MKLFKTNFFLMLALMVGATIACEQDDDVSNVIGGLDFNVATLNPNGNKVGVIATTVPGDNRVVYTIDFGATENDDSDVFQTSGPMVEYTYPLETATYTITVTASMTGRSDVSISKEHTVNYTIVTPPTGTSPLVGRWKLAPEAGALGVGPGLNNVSWWSSGAADVVTRSCLFDDEYVFNADGTFQNILGADTWVEAWQGNNPEGCASPVAPHNGTAQATYSYDATANTVTINGAGAFLGLAKVYNGGELTSPSNAESSITYITSLSSDGNTLELDIEIAGGGFWSFKLVKQVPPGIQGTWKLAPVAGALGVGPGLNDVSWWSSSSADISTRACLFDDKYIFNTDGTFQNVLGSTTWVEAWQGTNPEGCSAPVAPHNGTASTTYTYNATAGTITLNGVGAFLGLAKVYNGGELTSPSQAPNSITYIAELSSDGNTLDLDIEIAGGGFWSFKLTKE